MPSLKSVEVAGRVVFLIDLGLRFSRRTAWPDTRAAKPASMMKRPRIVSRSLVVVVLNYASKFVLALGTVVTVLMRSCG